MLKVCGITHDHTINYGSSLQAYALSRAVESVVLEDGTKCYYHLIPIRTFKEWLANPSFTKRLLTPIMNYYRTKFLEFDNNNLKFVNLNSLKDLSSLNNSEDAFICGSDVIWNPDLNKNFNAFYLDFASKYKFSYAASFGKSKIDSDTLNHIRLPLSELNSISVREKSAVEIVKQCTDKPVRIVADPVILLNKSEWEALFPIEKSSSKYIFVYITHLSDSIKKTLNNLKKITGYKIVYAASGPKQAIKQGMFQVQTPQQWLQLLHNAEFVVTNSFHATAFSVMFHKRFFTVVNGDKAKGINVRMNDFLNTIGLENRIFSDIPDNLDLSEIDYTDVDTKIEDLRQSSLAFLQENLEAAYQAKNRNE